MKLKIGFMSLWVLLWACTGIPSGWTAPAAPAEGKAAAAVDSQQNAVIAELREEVAHLKQDKGVGAEATQRSVLWKLSACLLALVIALALFRIQHIAIRKFEEFVSEKNVVRESAQTLRLKTLSKIFNRAGSVLILLALIYIILDIFGVNVAPLLAGAGIIGVALGLGAQYLIRDLINGMFILIEGQYGVNDVVKIGEFSGVVEDVSLRTTALRDAEGRLITIPNGEIKVVINETKDFAFAVIDVGVAYKENIDRVMEVLIEIGRDLKKDAKFGRYILEELEMLGIERFAESEVTLKFRVKTLPSKQWDVSRELRRRIKNRFDELGIEIPFPHQVVYWREGKAPVK